ncbi:MAG TPA: hypothetical protein VKX16_04920 [Chloroflexota bacterium]|nr:hypothetical protein [Chloroflexota bacterium]
MMSGLNAARISAAVLSIAALLSGAPVSHAATGMRLGRWFVRASAPLRDAPAVRTGTLPAGVRVPPGGTNVVTWDDSTSPISLAQWSTAGPAFIQRFILTDPVSQSGLVPGSNTLAAIPAGSACPNGGYVFANTGGFVDGLADGSTPGVISTEASSTADFNPQGHPVDVRIENTGKGMFAVVSSVGPQGATATESWSIANCGLTFVNLLKDPAGSSITSVTPTEKNTMVGVDSNGTNLWAFSVNPVTGRLAIARQPYAGQLQGAAGVDFVMTKHHVGDLLTGQSSPDTAPNAAGYSWNFQAGFKKPLAGSPAADTTATDCGGAGVTADPVSNTMIQLLNNTQYVCGNSPDVAAYTVTPFTYAASVPLPNAIGQFGLAELPASQAIMPGVSIVNSVYGEWDACALAGKNTTCSDFADYGGSGDFSTGVAIV